MIVDLFGGPGGWDYAARLMGLDVLGVEFDKAACETRRAAGLLTHEGDVVDFLATLLEQNTPVEGLIASPPCQTFSMAGKGAGRAALDTVLGCIDDIANGRAVDFDRFDDVRTGLVLQPLIYARELEPGWMAWEQVPTVRPVWEACSEVLRADGYYVWTGVLNAADYGVPQTRKRAVLIASQEPFRQVVGCPPPTHAKGGAGGLLPWVSMAQALGWGMTERPGPTLAVGKTGDGRVWGSESFGSAKGVTAEREAGRWQEDELGGRILVRDSFGTPSADYPGRTASRWKDAELVPSPTITSKTKDWVVDRPSWVHDEPAPTIVTTRRSQDGIVVGRQLPAGESLAVGGWGWKDVPLPDGQARINDQSGTVIDLAWVDDRPATTVATRDLIQHPGATTNRTNGSTKSRNDGVRVTVAEASVLQSFPADYPWQGSKTKQYQQVGNAIPPRLAAHILAEATGLALPAFEETDAVIAVGFPEQRRNSGPGAARTPRPTTEPSYTIRAAGSGSHPSGVEWVASTLPESEEAA